MTVTALLEVETAGIQVEELLVVLAVVFVRSLTNFNLIVYLVRSKFLVFGIVLANISCL